jgi:CRP/FNR family cyclic AMP-dependent transcriptional regulator
MKSMKDRFKGPQKYRLLNEALGNSLLLRNIVDLDSFAKKGTLCEYKAGEKIFEQGDPSNEIYFILSGDVDVVIHARVLAKRSVGYHVGEIALLDPTARRTAGLVANTDVLAMRITESDFTAFANSHPELWRRIAVDISRRLAERNKLIIPKREQPTLFIGCSTEGLSLAQEIQAMLDYDALMVEVWTDGVFNTSKTPIEDLCTLVERVDFGLIIMTADDITKSRGDESFSPRDNVVLELGMLIGRIGRERSMFLKPRGVDLKLPTDLIGVKPLDFNPAKATNLRAMLGPTCTELRAVVNRLGPI